MQTWLQRLLFATLATFATWILVIIYWRSSMHIPSTSDVVTYLVIVPLTLLLSVYAIQQAGLRLLAFTTRSPANNPTSTPDTQANQITEATKPGTILITASTIHTRFGTEASDIINAIQDNKTKFELDSELTDVNGYPVLTGRIKDLDTTAALAHFRQFITTLSLPEQTWQAEDQRTITLAHNVCLDLAQSLVAYQINTNPTIYLASVLPSSWTEAQIHQIRIWLIELLVTQGLAREQIMPSPLNALNLDDPLHIIDKINTQTNQQTSSELHLIIASDSYISESALHTTFTIPGEAAAGLIIAGQQWANTLALPAHVQAHRLIQRKRDKSADAAGKTKPDTLIETAEHAIEIANISKSAISTIFSDSDERPTRLGELFETINTTLPDIEITENCFQIARYCGEIGTTANLIAVATAVDQVKKSEQAALCLCNNDSLIRSAIILNIATPDQNTTPTINT